MNADGNNPVQLTKSPNGRDGQTPSFSRRENGLFSRAKQATAARRTMMKVSIEGGEATALMPESKISTMMPQISPDGKSLAYLSLEYDSKTSNFDMAVQIASLKGK